MPIFNIIENGRSHSDESAGWWRWEEWSIDTPETDEGILEFIQGRGLCCDCDVKRIFGLSRSGGNKRVGLKRCCCRMKRRMSMFYIPAVG
jgi:hypothetical protein